MRSQTPRSSKTRMPVHFDLGLLHNAQAMRYRCAARGSAARHAFPFPILSIAYLCPGDQQKGQLPARTEPTVLPVASAIKWSDTAIESLRYLHTVSGERCRAAVLQPSPLSQLPPLLSRSVASRSRFC